jgi:AbrB family transcriptional regulator, transcriptional pleiotropic regulator of transition state genes
MDGIRRKVDDLGRVVLPAQHRRALGISEGDEVEIAQHGDRLELRLPADRCTFCETAEDLERFLGKAVCTSCMAALRALHREAEGQRRSF